MVSCSLCVTGAPNGNNGACLPHPRMCRIDADCIHSLNHAVTSKTSATRAFYRAMRRCADRFLYEVKKFSRRRDQTKRECRYCGVVAKKIKVKTTPKSSPPHSTKKKRRTEKSHPNPTTLLVREGRFSYFEFFFGCTHFGGSNAEKTAFRCGFCL